MSLLARSQLGKRCAWSPGSSSWYFVVLLSAACLAAAPCWTDVELRCDSAKVSGTVTTHTIDLPLAHGINVAPSGCLPSCLRRPAGFLAGGICGLLTALHVMSFIWLCLCCLGALLRQDKPCKPWASTDLPHTQVCDSHARHPTLCVLQQLWWPHLIAETYLLKQ